jgi:hypothetical protein
MDWQLSTISEAMRVCFWGLIRTPPEKRDMAAIKKAAEDAGRLPELASRETQIAQIRLPRLAVAPGVEPLPLLIAFLQTADAVA